METLWQDIRYGARMLVKAPGFTAITVLTLALGIGANTAIFTLVKAAFLNPLPVADPDRLVAVFGTDTSGALGAAPFGNLVGLSHPNFEDYRDRNEVFDSLVVFGFTGLGLADGAGDPEQIGAQVVSANYFTTLGVRPLHGRFFTPEEDKPAGAYPLVVLSYDFWQRRFGGDPAVVNSKVSLNRQPYEIIGIAPEGFLGTFTIGGTDAWVPIAQHEHVFTGIVREWFTSRRALLFQVFGRLRPGVTLEQAQAAMTALGFQLEQEHPRDNEKRNVHLMPLAQAAIPPFLRENFVRAGWLLSIVVGLVLLIACVNLANLLLARAASRARELGIRAALGAGRTRLLRQMLTESTLLALAGGTAGLLVAYWGRDLLWSFRPPFLNDAALALSIDTGVLLFTLGVSLATGMLFGLLPALKASSPDLNETLKAGGRSGTMALGGGRLRSLLVVSEVGLALVALAGAGLFLRSMWQAQAIDPGFETRRMALMNFNLGAQGYEESNAQEFYRQAVERVARLPMVESASVAANPPFGGGFARTTFPEGADTSDRRAGQLTTVNSVDPHYFRTLGMPLLAGRDFTEHDRPGSTMVAILNQAAAARFFPDQDPISRRISFWGETWRIEIVGLVRDAKQFTLGEEAQAVIYLPIQQHFSPQVTLFSRTAGDPEPAIAAIRAEVQALDRNLPLTNVQPMAAVLEGVLWAPRMGAGLLGVFGALALLLAAVGIYGVMAQTVAQRTPEIGVRMALGARPGDVLGLVLRRGMALAGIGIAAGLAAGGFISALAAQQLGELLFGVRPFDPVTFAAVALLLGAVAAAACVIPARRAMRVDPVVALRYE
jgi:predicted permease